MHVVATTLPPLPVTNFLKFIGNDPASEKVSPLAFLRQFEMIRNLNQYTDTQLIIMAAQNFKVDGYAAIWWQVQMQTHELTGRMPFQTWADFRAAFLEGMRIYDEGTGVRMAMEGLKMQGDNLVEYIAAFRGHLVRLEAIKQPLDNGRAVFDFCKGLPHKLREKCPLAAGVTFETAAARVLEAFRKMQLNQRMRDLTARQGARLNNLEAVDEEYYHDAAVEDYLTGEDEDWYNEEQEVHLATMNTRGRGRGRGRGGAGRGAGGRPGRGRGGRSGGRGERRAGDKPGWYHDLSAKEKERYEAGQCVKCGSTNHFARDCNSGARQENAGG